MAFEAYASIKGKKQGQFKGESTKANRKDWIGVIAFTMGLKAPRDAATGQPTGKRQFEPVVLTKEWGAASPQGLTALATNESLPSVVVEFVTTNRSGEQLVYQTVTLTDASLTQILRSTSIPDHASAGPDTRPFESWSFTFRKIVLTDKEGNTTFSDEWSPNLG